MSGTNAGFAMTSAARRPIMLHVDCPDRDTFEMVVGCAFAGEPNPRSADIEAMIDLAGFPYDEFLLNGANWHYRETRPQPDQFWMTSAARRQNGQ